MNLLPPRFEYEEPVVCGSCTACCHQAVMLMSNEDHTQYETYTVSAPNLVDGSYPTYWLKRTDSGACVYLDPSKGCTIYERRPVVCQRFACTGWVKKILKEHPQRAERRRMLRDGTLEKEIWKAGMERLKP